MKDEDMEALAKKLLPASTKQATSTEFNLMAPAYSEVDQSVRTAERASTLSRLVLDSMLPLISSGKPAAARLCSWCGHLINVFGACRIECPILQAAKVEITTMATAVRLVSGGSSESIDALNVIMNSKAGNKQSLKLALTQSSYYRQEVAELRTTWSAWLTLQPELAKAEEGLKSKDAQDRWSFVKTTVASLVAWRNSLRESATASCEAALLEVFKERLQLMTDTKDQAGLSDLIQQVGHCEKLPSLKQCHIHQAYRSVLSECEKALSSLGQEERRLRIMKNFDQVAEMTKGHDCTDSLDKLLEFSQETQKNISELWVMRDKQDLNDEIRASCKATIPLIASGAGTCLETAMLLISTKPDEGKEVQEKLQKVARFFTHALEELNDSTAVEYVSVLHKHAKVLEAAGSVRQVAVNTTNQTFLTRATTLAVALTDSGALSSQAPQHQQAFHKSLEQLRFEGQKVQKALQAQVGQSVQRAVTQASDKLSKSIEQVKPWKESLEESPEMPWQQVVDAAKKSLVGADCQHTSTMVQCLKTLKKEHGAQCLKDREAQTADSKREVMRPSSLGLWSSLSPQKPLSGSQTEERLACIAAPSIPFFVFSHTKPGAPNLAYHNSN